MSGILHYSYAKGYGRFLEQPQALAGRQPCYRRIRGSGVLERKSLKPIPKASEDPHMFLFIDSCCLSKKAMNGNQNIPLKL
jgi:hypothetical protein